MTKINTLLNLSVLILGMTLLPQVAFPETKQGATKVTELMQTDLKIGIGEEASGGHTVKVHYTGWLYDATAPQKKGAKFDSSLDRGMPFTFPLGSGRVIKGWDQGVIGMKVGGAANPNYSRPSCIWFARRWRLDSTECSIDF